MKPKRSLLLSAGLGTRLRPLTLEKPKCLVEINKKPILEYWIDNLENIGIQKVLINTHYLAEKVNDFLSQLDLDQEIKELIIEKNQFILIDYLLNKSDTYKELRVE